MIEKIACVAHHGCPDGSMSAMLVHNHFKGEVTYFKGIYGQLPSSDLEDFDQVFIVDFSYPLPELEKLAARNQQIIILDHHKTAMETLQSKLPTNIEAIFDMDRSGATITWDYLKNLTPSQYPDSRPWYVDYTEDRDLWRFALPNSKEVNAFLMTLYPLENFDAICLALNGITFGEAIKAGTAIRYKINAYCKAMLNFVTWGSINNHKCPFVNASYPDTSDLLDYMIKELKVDLACSWRVNSFGKITFSLRSRGDFDVAALAQKYGGGGHKNASGFELNFLTLIADQGIEI